MIKEKKGYYLFIVIIYFFVFRDYLERVVPLLGYVDELIAAMAIPILLIRIMSWKNGNVISHLSFWKYILITTACGIISTVLYHYQPLKAVLPDMLLCLKFWLTIEVGRYVFRNLDIKKKANNLFMHIRFLTWFFTILVAIDYIHPIFNATTRYGMRSEQLFYTHPSEFASVMILLLAIILMISNSIPKNKVILYSVLISLLVMTSMRSKILGSIVAYWLIFYFAYYKKKRLGLKSLLMFVPLIVFIGWDQIDYYFLSDVHQGSARYQLLAKSLEIANDHFPIGSGFGTYGSYYSSVYYSPLYSNYGISTIIGLRDGAASFVSDSFWPMIIGQFGYLGLTGVVLALFELFKSIQKVRPNNLSMNVTGLFILSYLLIESTAASSFVHPYAMPFAMLIGYELCYIPQNSVRP